MTSSRIAIAILFAAAMLSAQGIPPGTALPVVLGSTLDARKLQPGQPVSGSIPQDVPLPSGGKIGVRSRIIGRVLQAGVDADGSSFIRMRWEQVRAKGRDLPLTASLRALASWWEVQGAQAPKHSPVRGETEANWTTEQVGGDVVYRGGGHVMHGDTVVGEPEYRGVLVELTAMPEAGCPGDSGGRRLALWVFSSSACGTYGFDGLEIVRTGETGEILLRSRTNVYVRGGSGMLLITTGAER
jgi:hypothetical protein